MRGGGMLAVRAARQKATDPWYFARPDGTIECPQDAACIRGDSEKDLSKFPEQFPRSSN
jgi:hypothetical protein